MILPADKGRATVILNTADYKTKCQDLLKDERTYKQPKKDPTNIYRTKLINLLKELKNSGAITQGQYYKVYPTATEPPKLYGLPKVHKPPCPLRPIVACRGSIMYGTARWVADILAPMVGKTSHHLQNSADLVNKLSQIRIDEDESLISFDVSALFTSVPVEESITLIHEKLTADPSLADRTALSPQQVTDLLRMCLTTTYFKYDGKFYAQIEGAAMGSPVSPIVANLFMEDYEGKALEAYQDPPKYWGRYVDDVLAVIKTANIEPFTQHLNAQHTSIQWTSELETDGKLPMLDTLTTRRTDGSLKFSVYRKPTHTDQYLQFQSHQPMEHKMSVIRTLTHRADTIISDPQDKEREMKHLKKVLSVAGYSRWAWQAPGRKKITPDHTPATRTGTGPRVT